MAASEVFRNVLLGVSGFACGMALYRVRLSLAHALAWGGYALTVGLVAEAIFRAPGIPVTWRALLYAGALFSSGVGMVMLNRNYVDVRKDR